MEPKVPDGPKPADSPASVPARTTADALAGALPAWDLLPEAPVRRK